jgi:hypothetical protein
LSKVRIGTSVFENGLDSISSTISHERA